MAREGVKVELDRRRREEDVTSSARMRLLLGCGKTESEIIERDAIISNKLSPSEVSTQENNINERQETHL